jgi:tape measure domain
MAGQKLRASIIIDLMGNIAQRSRQFGGNLTQMARSGQSAMRGLRSSVLSVSNSIDRLGASATGTFRTLTAGALGVAGMGYTANKLFISIASTRENQRIALNSMYKGDKEHADKMMQWAIQNAKDSTWGLTGVMQEFTSSKAFGMKDKEVQDFITMLEDQGALKGWSLDSAQGASMQLKQMYSRQQITAADANLLTGYGINVYQVLADATGKSARAVRKLGEDGKLGAKTIALLFRLLGEEAKGAQKNAMNSWTGLTAQMGDVWEGFADKLMNKGPFERLKSQLRDVLGWYDRVSKPDVSGISQLDRITDELAGDFNTAFNQIQGAARTTWRVLVAGKNALSWIDEHIIKLKTLAKVLGGIWLANKVGRSGVNLSKNVWKGLLRPSWKMFSFPFRLFFRKKKKPGVPDTPDIFQNPSLIQSVFVTNWPVGGVSNGNGGYIADGKRKNGPGRGKRRPVPVVPPAAAPVAAKAGLFSRVFGGVGRLIAGAGNRTGNALGSVGRWMANSAVWRTATRVANVPGRMGRGAVRLITGAGKSAGDLLGSVGRWVTNSAVGRMTAKGADALGQMGKGTVSLITGAGKSAGNMLGSAGRWMADSAVGRIAAKGAGALGWMGRGAGRLFSRLGGPLLSAATVAPVLLDDEATNHDKGSAVGGAAGAWAGGALGSLVGPLGTMAGATLGGVVGDYLGGFVADLYSKWNEPKDPMTLPEQNINAQASLRVELADGLRVTRSDVTENGLGMDVYTGSNYIPGF